MQNDELTSRISVLVSQYTRGKIYEIAETKKISISRLVAIAIDHELDKGKNAFNYDLSAPEDEFIPEAFLEEAGLIINYMKKSSGMPLDMMLTMRHDMGISDKKVFLLAFRECVTVGMLEAYKPRQPEYIKIKYDEDFVFYRVKGADKPAAKKARRKATKYELFQKLKKEFKDEK